MRIGLLIPVENEEPRNLMASATQLDVYSDTLDLQVKVYTQQVGYRPSIELIETPHPLFFEQENGITMERVTSFAKQIIYDH